MKHLNRIVWPGMLALALSGAASAHAPDGHGHGGWGGNVVIWGNPAGQVAYGGTLSYGVALGYAPGYAPWLDRGHGRRCHGHHGHEYPRGGHHHGRKHWRRHGHKHKGRHH